MVLQKNTENNTDRTCEQRGIFLEMGMRPLKFLLRHNKKGREFDTHNL